MNYQDWLRQHPTQITCGSCKATGIKHAWNKNADLVPVEPREPCQICHGTGWVTERRAPMEEWMKRK